MVMLFVVYSLKMLKYVEIFKRQSCSIFNPLEPEDDMIWCSYCYCYFCLQSFNSGSDGVRLMSSTSCLVRLSREQRVSMLSVKRPGLESPPPSISTKICLKLHLNLTFFTILMGAAFYNKT